MARKKRAAGRRGKRRPQRVLSDHHQHKRKLIPPLMRFPLEEISWHRDMLPDFLWLALMLGRRTDWQAARSALDVIDRFVPDGPRFADGRLSTFALVPESRRESARLALSTEAPHALPDAFGHALGLYPGCPARWLYAGWLERNEPNPEIGVALMRSLVEDNRDKSGVRETRLRMAAISRAVIRGKLQDADILELGPKYPNRLSPSEQSRLESKMRASRMSFAGMEAVKYPPNDWPGEFWRRSRELAPCQVRIEREEELGMPEQEDGPLDAEPLMQLSEVQAIVAACEDLGAELRKVQLEALKDPAADQPNAVLLGLASRMYRLLYAFIERPSAWAPDTAGLHLRPIVDARILVGWLITCNDPGIFAAYREHGLGRLKLVREHIKADFGEELDDSERELLDYLDARVNLERDEWFQPVNLGSFAVDIRKMAIEADLKREYDLTYAPLSSENHGEWPAVRDDDTLICEEPLHGDHRVGAFRPPQRMTSSAPVFAALDLARAGICQVFDHYEKDVGPAFVPVQKALEKAVYTDGGDQSPGQRDRS